MAHIVPCQKELMAEETVDLFIEHFYKIHGVPKYIITEKDTRFVVKFSQSFTRKLITKVNTSTARHSQANGLTKRVNETLKIFLRWYTSERVWI